MGKYDKIINLPHHTSKNRVRMSLLDRAAQFAPFAALTGYDDSIKEVARLTDKRIELSEDQKEEIGFKINYIISNKLSDEIEVLYFVKDLKKDGGAYLTYRGIIKKYDEINKKLYFIDKTSIMIEDIVSLNNDYIDSILKLD